MIDPQELERLKADMPEATIIKRSECKGALWYFAAQKDIIAITTSFGDYIFED